MRDAGQKRSPMPLPLPFGIWRARGGATALGVVLLAGL